MRSKTKSLFSNVCDEGIYAKLHAEHAKNLHDFIYYKYGNAVDPGDKVQEAFIKLWNLCKEVTPDKAKSFLFTVAKNLSLNDIKHDNVRFRYQTDYSAYHKDVDKNNPERILEEKEYFKKYEIALNKLSEAQRIAFLMNRAEGKKHQEIADILGISKKAVEKRIYGAVDKLMEEINKI
ncbi:sigma-70 family RNA polymerase sigma factor [Aquimarina sp. ERC-38]|uniref:RNA polymerase sigma factor n=1 Tax=Aquimarina sp. ERC-38 TaxID=2949996 RepID=UPI0022472D22|nr:sigma-70 family RNA polymerase sigma factor [Aquimarina sp. ERC-38]UZO79233.1 sigma-70 family RNA polymerase sigma factor [Aquimarina sp. ERC-38]